MLYQIIGGKIEIDEVDFPLVVLHIWHICKKGYAYTHIKRKKKYMHKFIAESMGIIGMTDHKDRIPSNNKRNNLRKTTRSLNKVNSEMNKNNKSGYKGVFLISNGSYRAQICKNRNKICLGLHSTAIEAAKAYNKAAKHYFGEHACLNLIPGE